MKNKTKTFIAGILVAIMAVPLLFSALGTTVVNADETNGAFPGSFLGVGPGLYGPVLVQVTMPDPTTISSVTVLSHDETHNIGNVPMELFSDLIVRYQTLQMPIVTGATISSMAMLTAVHDAINRSGASPASFTGAVTLDVPATDTSADIVVIGGGGAGLTAASFAAREGNNVILVEKTGLLGGTTSYVIEQIGSVGTITHQVLGTDVTPAMWAETIIANNPNGIPEHLEYFAHAKGPALDWLRNIGAPFTVAAAQTGVQPNWQIGEPGVAIVSALRLEAERAGVDVRTWSQATEILMTGDAVSGVRVSTPNGEYTISTSAVILATGGFTSNSEMVAEHRPDLAHLSSAASTSNQGQGHVMAQNVGAAVSNMDHIRMGATYATASSGYWYWVNHALNWGAILVNADGERFMNDTAGWPGGPTALAQGNPLYYIFDNTPVEVAREVRRFQDLGLLITADTLEELFTMVEADTDGLRATIERYVGFVENGVDEDFGRPLLNNRFNSPPFHAIRAEVRIQGTMGGVTTDLEARVLTPAGEPIPGLFAAGEVADDGLWGQNPAAINLVFGRVAGLSASEFVR
ncbi:MAG: FAD-binding protein [Defluviitaleaceae bacterium]|nr:FAD-binding protein [Defluviitaleaceae bacterium]